MRYRSFLLSAAFTVLAASAAQATPTTLTGTFTGQVYIASGTVQGFSTGDTATGTMTFDLSSLDETSISGSNYNGYGATGTGTGTGLAFSITDDITHTTVTGSQYLNLAAQWSNNDGRNGYYGTWVISTNDGNTGYSLSMSGLDQGQNITYVADPLDFSTTSFSLSNPTGSNLATYYGNPGEYAAASLGQNGIGGWLLDLDLTSLTVGPGQSTTPPAGVPEPPTLALMFGGLIALGFLRRRRTKA